MIQYSPIIADTIPGFTTQSLIVPFTHNSMLLDAEVKGYSLRLQPYNNVSANNINQFITYDIDLNASQQHFEIEGVEVGQYYKIQIAYVDNNGIPGIYSSTSIGRCVVDADDTDNICQIIGLQQDILNLNTDSYVAMYTAPLVSEPVYSYRFWLTEGANILQDTGEILHNARYDTKENNIRSCEHRFLLKYELDKEKYYVLHYAITTVNGYQQEVSYNIIAAALLPSLFNGNLIAEQGQQEYENGYVKISISSSTPVAGQYVLERTSNGYEWNLLAHFSMSDQSNLEDFVWLDKSVEQGVKYTYAIRAIYEDIRSERILSNPIVAEFEHMFLGDGEKQLKIEYNPKVSSFKNTILEQKTDTIGGQYPFFFRNNQVKYKEIPISGLISYQIDSNNFFITDQELGLEEEKTRTTNLVDYNFTAERKFKLAVLEWLTNGQPKLFRSPAEGNYVVRLMNTSLSPNDTLGRMLHTFSSTGYEIASSNIENLLTQQIIKFTDIEQYDIGFIQIDTSNKYEYTNIHKVKWETAYPNATDKITFTDKAGNTIEYINKDGIFETAKNDFYNSIQVTDTMLIRGDTITFYYEVDEKTNNFYSIAKGYKVLFSVPPTEKLNNDDQTLSYYYQIIAIGVSDDSQIKIDDQIIYLGDRQPRYYNDITVERFDLKAIRNTQLYIYALANELSGDYIVLGYSRLGDESGVLL